MVIVSTPGVVVLPVYESFQDRVFYDKSFKSPDPAEMTAQSEATSDQPLVDAPEAPAMELDAVIRSKDNLEFCKRIDRKLASVTLRGCLQMAMHKSEYRSVKGEPIYYVNFEATAAQKPLGKVLVLGGVHGDELTSISTVYLWISTLKEFHSGLFDWRVVPLVNPDGFFSNKAKRTNANGVDLNRNLPTYQWNQLANRYWQRYAGGTERKFPGYNPASEPETEWLINEINTYKPDVIVTVHAPYNLVDFDAADRSSAPRRLGVLPGKSLGTFPGSLGRYAGEERNIPVITLELPHSWRMPPKRDVNAIWDDLVVWLRQNINTHNIAGRSFNQCAASPLAVGCI